MLGGYHFFGYMLVLIFKMIFQESGLSYIYIYIYMSRISNFFLKIRIWILQFQISLH
jgi:hypothetical protein